MTPLPCPRCSEPTPMSAELRGALAFQGCPRCAGSLVRLRDLAKHAAHRAHELIEVGPLPTEIEARADSGQRLVCVCGAKFEAFNYLGLPHVVLDRCEACEVVWLDAEELDVVALLMARSDAAIRRRYDQAQRERAAQAIVELESQAEIRALRERQGW